MLDKNISKKRNDKNCWLPIVSTIILYVIFTLILQFYFAITFEKSRQIGLDIGISLILSYFIFGMSRSNLGFLAIQTLMFIFLFMGHGTKIREFGGPLTPTDMYAFFALVNILMGWRFWVLIAFLSIATVILIYNLKLFSRTGAFSALTFIGLISLFINQAPMITSYLNRHVGYVVWSQRINYVKHGPFLYTLYEIARYLSVQKEAPTDVQVEKALRELKQKSPQALYISRYGEQKPRNVHLILLESFWDPTQLPDIDFSQDPFSPRFRKLWQDTLSSTALSPVYGGYTANAEFEVLCGFPIEDEGVKFEHRMSNSNLPCLPNLLREYNYISYASHPNIASFWNRINAYKQIGFSHSFFLNDYKEIDMAQNEFMSDKEFYKQTFELIAKHNKTLSASDASKPIFNYMVTIFGHLPYPLTPDRPKVISSKNASSTLEAYANNVFYKTTELMDLLDKLKQDDPDALIVMFGDHLPNLGPNFASYESSGFLSANKSEFTGLMLKNMVTTPLIILDGRRGAQSVGSISMDQLPQLILKYLDLPENNLLSLTKNTQDTIRPLPGQILQINKNHAVTICREDESPCTDLESHMDNIRTLSIDIFEGKQHSLKSLAP
ncbi:sulfatase [Gammaproteobacteria bacterium]|nr:sulfatase [Gammaproteobacteria bacterium]